MKKIFQTLSFVFALAFAMAGFTQEKKEEISLEFDKDLPKLATEINKHCPYMLDTATRLDSAAGDTSNSFTYYFTLVKQTVSELDLPKLKSNFKENIVRFIRLHPDMAGFVENKVTLFYHYNDKSRAFITEIKIGPDDYLAPAFSD